MDTRIVTNTQLQQACSPSVHPQSAALALHKLTSCAAVLITHAQHKTEDVKHATNNVCARISTIPSTSQRANNRRKYPHTPKSNRRPTHALPICSPSYPVPATPAWTGTQISSDLQQQPATKHSSVSIAGFKAYAATTDTYPSIYVTYTLYSLVVLRMRL